VAGGKRFNLFFISKKKVKKDVEKKTRTNSFYLNTLALHEFFRPKIAEVNIRPIS
jgi:hypothetical protein